MRAASTTKLRLSKLVRVKCRSEGAYTHPSYTHTHTYVRTRKSVRRHVTRHRCTLHRVAIFKPISICALPRRESELACGFTPYFTSAANRSVCITIVLLRRPHAVIDSAHDSAAAHSDMCGAILKFVARTSYCSLQNYARPSTHIFQ